MRKIELKVLGLSVSQSQTGSYVLVLSEVGGNRRLPVIIKPADAQFIALKVEGVKSPKPQTLDLFKSMTDKLGADLMEVYIENIVEGTFYCKLILSNQVEDFEIECSIGDAISLSLVYGCDLTASNTVVMAVGISVDDDGKISEENKPSESVVGIKGLEIMLQKAIDNEEYEIASQVRDRIEELKNKI